MKRRRFFETTGCGVFASAWAASTAFVAKPDESAAQSARNPNRANKPGERPNILVFLADDAGWGDFGFHGSQIRTPVLDGLARKGVELTQFYACAVCSPTRAALMTGRPPSRYNILTPLQLEHKEALPPGTVTIAELLRRNGYDTAITGKWHLGMTPELGPNRYGFRHSYGYVGPWIDSWSHLTTDFKGSGQGVRQWHRNGELIDEHGHVTDLITVEAIRYLREIRDKSKPFFLYVPFSAPHTPIQEEKKWLEPYDGIIENTSRKYYAAAITHMDDCIGKILRAAGEEGVLDNTLVIFFSDNGSAPGGEYRKTWLKPPVEYYQEYGPTDLLGDNAPYRGWKGSHYEGGVRVPALACWPGKLNPGGTDEPMIVYDLYPTLAHLAGAGISKELNIEGKNIWPSVAEGADNGERTFYWRLNGNLAVRKGDWKLIHKGRNPAQGSNELYNIADDPYEKTDQAAARPEKVGELMEELNRQFARDPNNSR
ncbi:MAG: sulfatase-like hydrolase/transferase [Candidatus Latescibacterota bacterium]